VSNKATVAVLSYELIKHPRAIKIVKTLLKNNYRVIIWYSTKPFKKGPKIVRALMNYLYSIVEALFLKANMYWIENIPDIVYILYPILRRNYVYDRRSPWSKEVILEYGFKIFGKIAEIIERFLIKHAKCIAVASTPLKFEFNYEKPVYVVPNYPEKSFSLSGKQRNNVGKGKILLYVGKLSIVEGTDILLKVARKLCNSETQLWIVGDGPLKHMVKTIAEKCPNVKWFGWLSRDKVKELISLADYCLVPRHKTRYSIFYNHEGVQKIGEYLALKKPVIACGIAKSPYYYLVSEDSYVETILKITKEEISITSKPLEAYWEDCSEKEVLKAVAYTLKAKEEK